MVTSNITMQGHHYIVPSPAVFVHLFFLFYFFHCFSDFLSFAWYCIAFRFCLDEKNSASSTSIKATVCHLPSTLFLIAIQNFNCNMRSGHLKCWLMVPQTSLNTVIVLLFFHLMTRWGGPFSMPTGRPFTSLNAWQPADAARGKHHCWWIELLWWRERDWELTCCLNSYVKQMD